MLDRRNFRGSVDKSQKFPKKWSLENNTPLHQSPAHHHKNFFKSRENLTQ